MASRSKEKAGAAIQRLKEETGKQAVLLELDLSKLASVRQAADEFSRCVVAPCLRTLARLTLWYFHSKERELHLLFNNA